MLIIRLALGITALMTHAFSQGAAAAKPFFDDRGLDTHFFAIITRTEKDSIRDAKPNQVLNTNRYSNLKDGLFVLVPERAATLEEAKVISRKYPGSYVKQVGNYVHGSPTPEHLKNAGKAKGQIHWLAATAHGAIAKLEMQGSGHAVLQWIPTKGALSGIDTLSAAAGAVQVALYRIAPDVIGVWSETYDENGYRHSLIAIDSKGKRLDAVRWEADPPSGPDEFEQRVLRDVDGKGTLALITETQKGEVNILKWNTTGFESSF